MLHSSKIACLVYPRIVLAVILRQGDGKCSMPAQFTSDTDGPTVPFYNRLSDGKPQAFAALMCAAALLNTIEPVEQAGNVYGLYALAAVFYRKHDLLADCLSTISTVPPSGVYLIAFSTSTLITRVIASVSA